MTSSARPLAALLFAVAAITTGLVLLLPFYSGEIGQPSSRTEPFGVEFSAWEIRSVPPAGRESETGEDQLNPAYDGVPIVAAAVLLGAAAAVGAFAPYRTTRAVGFGAAGFLACAVLGVVTDAMTWDEGLGVGRMGDEFETSTFLEPGLWLLLGAVAITVFALFQARPRAVGPETAAETTMPIDGTPVIIALPPEEEDGR